MLVEHSFITTADQKETMSKALSILTELGFKSEAFVDVKIVTCQSGAASVRQAKNLDQVPQRVMVEFDRGRVTVAVTMEEAPQYRKQKRVMESRIIALATLLEKCLGGHLILAAARAEWDAVHAEMAMHDRSRRRVRVIAFVLLMTLFLGLAVVVVTLRE